MISEAEQARLRRSYPALGTLPADLADALARMSQPVEAPAGRRLFEVDHPCRAFLALTSGSIRISRPGRRGREIVLYRLQPGECCGLTVACLLGAGLYSARGIAETVVAGAWLPQALFAELLERAPAFRAFIFAALAERLIQLIALVEDVALRRLDQRLAHLLLTHGPTLHTTHQELADELGSTREMISRTLGVFGGKGAVRLRRGAVDILDPDYLLELSD